MDGTDDTDVPPGGDRTTMSPAPPQLSSDAVSQWSSADGKVDLTAPRTPADQLFRAVLVGSASLVLVVISAIVVFLMYRSWRAWKFAGIHLFVGTWVPKQQQFGFRADLIGSVIVALIALVIAVPIGVATAIAINEYVPRRFRAFLAGLVDLLAAVPSLVYGLWGVFFLSDHLFLTSKWLGHHANFFPLFRLAGLKKTTGSLFDAGVVVAIMILPLITAISREVMSQVPREDCEAALALGGTRWGMISDVVIPFSRNGIIGGAMLGLGRALGETIAVSLILAADDQFNSHVLQPGGGTISALIANNFGGTGDLERSALTAAGLTLFAITLAVNVAARVVVSSGTKSR